jgi:hypothetical protein
MNATPADVMPSAFDVLPGSVMKSIRHRWLLKEWELGRAGRPLPARAHLAREEFNPYRGEFSVFELRHEGAGLRFLLSSHGSFIGRAYGSNCTGRYLDQIVPVELQELQIEPYAQAVRHRRPVYVSSDTRDLAAKPIQFERLLLPFSEDGTTPSCVIADFEMISIEGNFSPAEMLTAKNAVPSRRIAAVIGVPGR